MRVFLILLARLGQNAVLIFGNKQSYGLAMWIYLLDNAMFTYYILNEHFVLTEMKMGI